MMKEKLQRIQRGGILLALILFGIFQVLFIGCQTTPTTSEGDKSMATGKSGNELWAENCVRCHNNRSPASYSDTEWEVAMMHMRLRANLTAEEHKKILTFLQAGN